MLYVTLRRAAYGLLFCCALVALAVDAASAHEHAPSDLSIRAFLIHWNSVAIDASGVDHTPVAPGEDRVYGEALGPGRASRAMAIVHVAMFDAMLAINGGFKPYTDIPRVRSRSGLDQSGNRTGRP